MSVVSALTQPSAPLKPIQSGPYTKSHFQSTIEGARNVRNAEEIEHLLRDYPAALDLYRTGKYKVKVKCETDVERVILVEKRSTKSKADNSVSDETHQSLADEENRPHDDDSKSTPEHQTPTSSEHYHKETLAHTASSSIRMTSNTQPKVDQHRAMSKERLNSVTPSVRQHGKSSKPTEDPNPSANNQVNEYPMKTTPVTIHPGSAWPQYTSRPLHPYWSNPLLQKGQGSNPYAPFSAAAPQPNPFYPSGFYNGQRPTIPSLSQPIVNACPPISTTRSGIDNQNLNDQLAKKYSASRNSININQQVPSVVPTSYRSIHSNQVSITAAGPVVYQSQMSMPRNGPWGTMFSGSSRPVFLNHAMQVGQMANARHRARSVDPNSRRQVPLPPVNFQQPNPMSAQFWNRAQPAPLPKPTDQIPDEKPKPTTVQPKEQVNTEKLSIRQLQETFLQTNSAGRLPIQLIPDLLQRFGITLTVQELISAAQELQYNYNEPISARRLIHMLVKLGRIAKSTPATRPVTNQEQTNPSS